MREFHIRIDEEVVDWAERVFGITNWSSFFNFVLRREMLRADVSPNPLWADFADALEVLRSDGWVIDVNVKKRPTDHPCQKLLETF